ncbi:hypothetical protein ACFL6N_03580 [Thermodesulfobacteriota bacterium]
MAGPKTIDEMLTSEIKSDLASRYFGFRKLIEEDKIDLEEKIRQYSFILQKRISFDLIRIYILLKEEDLIQAFLDLVNLNQRLFFDPYLTESPTIAQRVFECQQFSGFTQAGRFKNYFFECYENLSFHVEIYSRKIRELEEEQGAISDEIKYFYQKNDINAIMGFLQSLSREDQCGCMAGGMETGLAAGLSDKLRIEPPLPVEQVLPVLEPLKSMDEIKGELKKIIKLAYAAQGPEFLKMFSRSKTPCDRRRDRAR